MKFLNEDDLHEINRMVVSSTGGSFGAVNEANLHYVCARAKTISKSFCSISAYYFFSLAFEAHAFTDGNKRTSISAVVSFLAKNGRNLVASEEELIGYALLVASGQVNRKELELWLKNKIERNK